MSNTFDDKNKLDTSYADTGVIVKLPNAGDTIEGVYLGYKPWVSDKYGPAKVVRAHAFAEAKSSTAIIPEGDLAVFNGVTKVDNHLGDVPPGTYIGIRFDGKTKNPKSGMMFNDFSFFPVKERFCADWPKYAKNVPGLIHGELTDEAQQRIIAGETVSRTSEAPAAAPATPETFPAGSAAAELSDAFGDGQPFLTDAEKYAEIVRRVKAKNGPMDDVTVIQKVMSDTGLPMLPANYDAILAKVK